MELLTLKECQEQLKVVERSLAAHKTLRPELTWLPSALGQLRAAISWLSKI